MTKPGEAKWNEKSAWGRVEEAFDAYTLGVYRLCQRVFCEAHGVGIDPDNLEKQLAVLKRIAADGAGGEKELAIRVLKGLDATS